MLDLLKRRLLDEEACLSVIKTTRYLNQLLLKLKRAGGGGVPVSKQKRFTCKLQFENLLSHDNEEITYNLSNIDRPRTKEGLIPSDSKIEITLADSNG